jgi:hypothetical protein
MGLLEPQLSRADPRNRPSPSSLESSTARTGPEAKFCDKFTKYTLYVFLPFALHLCGFNISIPILLYLYLYLYLFIPIYYFNIYYIYIYYRDKNFTNFFPPLFLPLRVLFQFGLSSGLKVSTSDFLYKEAKFLLLFFVWFGLIHILFLSIRV